MHSPYLDALLGAMLESHENISDLVFVVGRPLQVESDGQLYPVHLPRPIHALSPWQTERIAMSILGDSHRLWRDLLRSGACDCSYALGNDQCRFRVNIFRQRGRFGIVMRRTQAQMPTLESLQLPPIFKKICQERHGLVLVTGASGHGKTTTLSAMLDEINATQAVHVVTLEDPIEFVHEHKRATFSQREYGSDFEDFASGLRSAVRQAPKVILVGEIRDRATMEIALTAAETGHLVLSSLHTVSAGQTINRLLGMFEAAEQGQLRLRLMEMLRYIVAQRLAPKANGGRELVQEIMGSNLRVREAISLGESENRSFYDIIDASSNLGWTTFDQSLAKAALDGRIAEETALLYADNRNRLIRLLDEGRKARGEHAADSGEFKLDAPAPAPAAPPSKMMRLSR